MNLQLTFSIVLSLTTVFCLAEDCPEATLTSAGWQITSPNYPEAYPHNANCSWVINAPEGDFVRLTFEDLDILDPFWDCKDDFVSVDDGNKAENFCKTSPSPITSVGNKMIIKFVTDDFFKNGNGFRATYQFVDKNGNSLGGTETAVDSDEDDAWDWEKDEDEVSSTPAPSTTTTTTTVATTTTQTTSTTTTERPKTSSLIKKILTTKLVTKDNQRDDNDSGISNNPGAMSGAVIGGIIGVVLIVFVILLFVAFVHWRQQKNKRIDLTSADNYDGKTLIKDGKKYKKIVRLPEAETFPL